MENDVSIDIKINKKGSKLKQENSNINKIDKSNFNKTLKIPIITDITSPSLPLSSHNENKNSKSNKNNKNNNHNNIIFSNKNLDDNSSGKNMLII